MRRTQLIMLVAGAALSFGFAGAALAQPDVKTELIPTEARDIFWCNAVFYEESFWHEVESPLQVFYDGKSLELDGQSFALMVDSGAMLDVQYWDLWEAYAAYAYDMYEADNAAFTAARAACESTYGGPQDPVDPLKPGA